MTPAAVSTELLELFRKFRANDWGMCLSKEQGA